VSWWDLAATEPARTTMLPLCMHRKKLARLSPTSPPDARLRHHGRARQFLQGVLVGAIGVALTPWVKHIVPQPGRRRAAMQASSGRLLTMRSGEGGRALSWQRNSAPSITTPSSGASMAPAPRWSTGRASSRSRLLDQEEALRLVLRKIQDALDTLGPVERAQTTRWLAGKKVEDESLEVRLLGEPEM
jgi:hypothetical protein